VLPKRRLGHFVEVGFGYFDGEASFAVDAPRDETLTASLDGSVHENAQIDDRGKAGVEGEEPFDDDDRAWHERAVVGPLVFEERPHRERCLTARFERLQVGLQPGEIGMLGGIAFETGYVFVVREVFIGAQGFGGVASGDRRGERGFPARDGPGNRDQGASWLTQEAVQGLYDGVGDHGREGIGAAPRRG